MGLWEFFIHRCKMLIYVPFPHYAGCELGRGDLIHTGLLAAWLPTDVTAESSHTWKLYWIYHLARPRWKFLVILQKTADFGMARIIDQGPRERQPGPTVSPTVRSRQTLILKRTNSEDKRYHRLSSATAQSWVQKTDDDARLATLP